ncbi:MAG: hypothetical protein ACOYO1_10285 [Bacteroidales bacterium]
MEIQILTLKMLETKAFFKNNFATLQMLIDCNSILYDLKVDNSCMQIVCTGIKKALTKEM